MAPFSRLIRFESGGSIFFSDIAGDTIEPPSPGRRMTAFLSLDDLKAGKDGVTVTLDKASLFPASRVLNASS
jgi:hypothetical protein